MNKRLSVHDGGTSWAYSDAGSHCLEVNSECGWTVKVIDEP